MTTAGCMAGRGQARPEGHEQHSEFSPVGHRSKVTPLGSHQNPSPPVHPVTKIVVSQFPCAQVFLGDGPLLALPAPVPAVWGGRKQGEGGEGVLTPRWAQGIPGAARRSLNSLCSGYTFGDSFVSSFRRSHRQCTEGAGGTESFRCLLRHEPVFKTSLV